MINNDDSYLVRSEMIQVLSNYEEPHVLMRPKVFPDGDQWCSLYGENIQEGVCGFGDTPAKACQDFDNNWYNQKLGKTRD